MKIGDKFRSGVGNYFEVTAIDGDYVTVLRYAVERGASLVDLNETYRFHRQSLETPWCKRID